MPLLCVLSFQKSILCRADFGCTFALDVQQKLKPFLHSSKEQMALRSFLGIYDLSCSSEQDRGQKVVHRGALHLCRGDLNLCSGILTFNF